MISKKTLDALASTIYLGKLQLRGETVMEDDQKIRASGLYEDFDEAKAYNPGDVCNAIGQTWENHQAIDPAKNPGVVPGSSAWPTFFRPLHGKTRETARPFVRPQYGTTDIYKYGEWMIYTDGEYYECIAKNGTNFSPIDYPAGWRKDVEVTS